MAHRALLNHHLSISAGSLSLVALLGIGSLVGCGSSKDDGGSGVGNGTGASSNGSGATSNGSGATSSGATGSGTGGSGLVLGTGANPADSSDPGELAPDEACATSTLKASAVPVNMFIQFDRSGSMGVTGRSNSPGGGNGQAVATEAKWPKAVTALNSFFQDPATAGLRVALRFFPHDLPEVGCTRDGATSATSCVVQACAKPLVDLGELKAEMAPMDLQEQKLLDAVKNATPPPSGQGDGGTPMYPALAGALEWAKAHQASTPGEKTIVVLVTDGSPTGCNTQIAAIADLASAALTESGVLTYAIGIEGAQEAQVNRIAEAGGTAKAFFVGAVGAELQLIQALSEIRGSALSCDISLPSGADVDPKQLNLNLTRAGAMPVRVGQAANVDSCEKGGWYYDDPANPKRIALCPSTCAEVKADATAQLDVVLGCETDPVN